MAELKLYGTADYVFFPLVDFDDTDFEKTPATFEAGDSQILKDDGVFANTANLPTYAGNGIYKILLTDDEYTCKKIVLTIIDQTPSALWEDQAIYIETYGDEDAQHTIVYFGGTVATIIPDAPVSADACCVYEFCMQQDVTPMVNAQGTAQIDTLPYDYSDSLYAGSVVDGTYNALTGLLYWNIVRGASVKFLIPSLGKNVIVTVPDAETARLTDL